MRGADFCFAEDPRRGCADARLLWSRAFDPGVLSVSAESVHEGGWNLRIIRTRRLIVSYGDCVQHIAIAVGKSWLRLDVVEGDALHGSIRFVFHFRDYEPLAPKIDGLAVWMRLCGATGASRWRPPSDRRLVRLIEALRVGDAIAEGASLREIAVVLRSSESVASDWPGAGDSVKSWIRRRVDLAKRLRAAGPAAVLHRSI